MKADSNTKSCFVLAHLLVLYREISTQVSSPVLEFGLKLPWYFYSATYTHARADIEASLFELAG